MKRFRLFASQRIDAGMVKAREVAEGFGVPLATVKRYGKLYRQQGVEGFFERHRRQRSETKLTGESKQQAQPLWEQGRNVAEVGRAFFFFFERAADDATQSNPESTAGSQEKLRRRQLQRSPPTSATRWPN